MNSNKPLLVTCVTLLAVLASSGCQTLTNLRAMRAIKRPTATVFTVELVETTEEGAVVRVLIKLDNPNPVALPLVTSKYTVTLGDRYAYSITGQPNRTLPALGRQTLELPAAFATAGEDLTGISYRVSGTIEYQPPGQFPRIMNESGIPLPSVPYSAKGQLRGSVGGSGL